MGRLSRPVRSRLRPRPRHRATRPHHRRRSIFPHTPARSRGDGLPSQLMTDHKLAFRCPSCAGIERRNRASSAGQCSGAGPRCGGAGKAAKWPPFQSPSRGRWRRTLSQQPLHGSKAAQTPGPQIRGGTVDAVDAADDTIAERWRNRTPRRARRHENGCAVVAPTPADGTRDASIRTRSVTCRAASRAPWPAAVRNGRISRARSRLRLPRSRGRVNACGLTS